MKLTELQLRRVTTGIAAATTPLDALIAALRQTFIELGAGDIGDADGPTIDGREWKLDPEQWVAIGNALVKRNGELVGTTANGTVNLALDWMNKGPSTETAVR
jgi:hypothetical protein